MYFASKEVKTNPVNINGSSFVFMLKISLFNLGLTHQTKETRFLGVNFLTQPYSSTFTLSEAEVTLTTSISRSETWFLRKSYNQLKSY